MLEGKNGAEILGVSVVICCHNGAALLPPTLDHLKRQNVSTGVPWEVLLVDNASTDGTAEAAKRCWGDGCPVPLRVVREDRLGLTLARERGFQEARYEGVGFIDDDNWVCDDWVQHVAELMRLHPEAGAFGGFSEPVFEQDPPFWFDRYMNCYAVGPDGAAVGDITESRGMLWGSGMTVRLAAWRGWRKQGLRFLTGIVGDDHEISLSLRLGGWRLWLDPDLKLKHFCPRDDSNGPTFGLCNALAPWPWLMLMPTFLSCMAFPRRKDSGPTKFS